MADKEEIKDKKPKDVSPENVIDQENPENATKETAPETGGDDKQEPPVEVEVEGASTEEQPSEETTGISTYFPNVEVTDANRAELEAAVASLQEHEQMLPKVENYKKTSRELAALLAGEPELEQVLIDMRKGADFKTALARYVDIDAIQPMEGDPDYEAWGKAREERMKSLEEREGRTAKRAENEQASLEALMQYKEQKGWKDEEALDFIDKAFGFLEKAFDGNLGVDDFERLRMALDYENDTEAKYNEGLEEGEIKARNLKISEMKEKKAEEKDTGLPELDGGGEVSTPKEEDPFIQKLKNRANRKPVLG